MIEAVTNVIVTTLAVSLVDSVEADAYVAHTVHTRHRWRWRTGRRWRLKLMLPPSESNVWRTCHRDRLRSARNAPCDDWCGRRCRRSRHSLLDVKQELELLVELPVSEYEQEDVEGVVAESDAIAHLDQSLPVGQINQRSVVD